jgi:hypothetical protein
MYDPEAPEYDFETTTGAAIEFAGELSPPTEPADENTDFILGLNMALLAGLVLAKKQKRCGRAKQRHS